MKKQGSLSLFSALSIMLVASVLLVFLEAARVCELQRVTQITTDAALESVFAGYDRKMWDSWRLLVRSAEVTEGETLSFEKITEDFRKPAAVSLNPSAGLVSQSAADLLCAELTDLDVQAYTLITDSEGKAFERAVCNFMKNGISVLAAEKIKQQYETQDAIEEVDVDEAVSAAKDGISQAKKDAQERTAQAGDDSKAQEGENFAAGSAETKEGAADAGGKKENPLEIVISLKKKGILSLLAADPEQLSDKEITLKNTVSHRKLISGNGEAVDEDGWYGKILVGQYYAKYFGDYLSPDESGALKYEREYLLCGKKSDLANLKSCVNKIMLLREGGNFLYLLQDSGKKAEALALATLLAGASANPAIIEAVEYGILAAWAYVESVLDMRSLLAGEKISLIKNAEEWTSDLDSLGECASGSWRAVSCERGMTYSGYLNMFLYLDASGKTAYRAMDLQELFLQKQEGYESFRMDQMVLSMTVEAEYKFSGMFLCLVTLGDVSNKTFAVKHSGQYSYYE